MLSTTPASPATLKDGQTLAVTVQFSAGNARDVNVSVLPMTGGAPTPWLPGGTIFPGAGLARSFFSCSDADVDQLEVRVEDVSNPGWTRTLVMGYFPVDFHWR